MEDKSNKQAEPEELKVVPGGEGEPAPARVEVVSALQIIEYELEKPDRA